MTTMPTVKQDIFSKNKCTFVFHPHDKMKSIWASTRENLSSGFANNTGADQPAHPRRLIRAFLICFLESIISKLAVCQMSIFKLVSVAEELV